MRLKVVAAFVALGFPHAVQAAQARWTVMLYMAGDSSLEEYVALDLQRELAKPGSTEAVQVVALADRTPYYSTNAGDWASTKIFHVAQGMEPTAENALEDWGECSTGDPQTLVDFVTWSKGNFPADKYVLIFWGHGWSWRNGAVMSDMTDNHDALSVVEVKAALPALGFIDVVGFDACNMGSIEIELLWKGHAAAMVHSQEWVGMQGLNYSDALITLNASPNMTADEVAVAMARATPESKTYSAVALDERHGALVAAVDAWAEALLRGLPAHRDAYAAAFAQTRHFWQDKFLRDLFDMAQEVRARVRNEDSDIAASVADASLAVMAAVEVSVLYERHVRHRKGSHGISIYLMTCMHELGSKHTAYYKTLDLAQQTQWDEFLTAYATNRMCEKDLRSIVHMASVLMGVLVLPGLLAAGTFAAVQRSQGRNVKGSGGCTPPSQMTTRTISHRPKASDGALDAPRREYI